MKRDQGRKGTGSVLGACTLSSRRGKLSTDPASVEAATGQLKTTKKPKLSTDPISVEAGYNRTCGMNCGWFGRAGSVQKQRQCDDALGL